MILFATLIGAILGVSLVFAMYTNGMLAERSGASILLAAVALFYPVFAHGRPPFGAGMTNGPFLSGFCKQGGS